MPIIRKTVFSVVAIMLFCAAAEAHEFVVPSELAALRKGFDFVYNAQFAESEKVFREYINKYPDRPEGYFFMSGRYAEYMNATHDQAAMPLFKTWASRTMEKAAAFNSAHPHDPTGHFYLGNLYGYMGLLEAQQQNMVAAFLNAVKAKDSLEKTLELDPGAYDAYFGLGSLYYYGSKKHEEEGGMTGWIIKKFITHDRDMRKEGIAMIHRAVANRGISADSAYSALMWIMIIEGRYDEAMPIADEVSRRWPMEKHAFWARGRIELLRGQCADAKRKFDWIVELLRKENVPLARFPEVEMALELSSLCLENDSMPPAIRETRIKTLRARLAANPNIQLEYPNSKGVLRDFTAMLEKIDKREFIQPGNPGKK
jgi:tetratricopeptide (TPR) repeat protein